MQHGARTARKGDRMAESNKGAGKGRPEGFRYVTCPASAQGWMRRSELGANVWERPDGSIYRAENGNEPEVIYVVWNRTYRKE